MTDNLLAKIRAMPKIELHRHLEGAVRLDTLVDIARKNGVEMPEYDVETIRPFVQMMPSEPRTWQNFLAKFQVLRQFFAPSENICRITREAIIDAANDNVKYLELRFTPRAWNNSSDCPTHQIVAWACETATQTAKEYDIQVKLIVSMNRHESLEIGHEAMKAAIDHKDLGVVGLDLAGVEVGYPAHLFRDIFHEASEAGLGITIHAGEWEGPQSIWDAISSMKVDRIGHGIRVLEDYGVVNVLIDQGIILEVCPSSNVDTGVVADMESHPLPRLIANNIKTTINTDDPLVSGITLSDEYYRVVQQTPLALDDLKKHTLVAAQSAFLQDKAKAELVDKFQKLLYP